VECQETSDAKVQEKRTMGTKEHQKNKQQKVSIEKMDWMPPKGERAGCTYFAKQA
jgi:hypothetical protein